MNNDSKKLMKRPTTSWLREHSLASQTYSNHFAAAGRFVGLRYFVFLVLFLLGTVSSSAQEGLGSAGAFMRLGIGARAGSLGDAYVAAASGPEAIYWNAAAMAVDPAVQFALTQRRYSFDRNFSFAGVTLPVGGRSAVGLGWTGFRTGGLEARTGNTAAPDNLFSNEENALAATMGYRLSSWLYAGVTTKFISQKLFDRSATGVAAGTSFLFKPLSHFSFGFALQDLFTSFKWQANAAERLPSTLMLGTAWHFSPQALLTLDYHYAGPKNLFTKDWWRRKGRVRAGTELRTLRSLPLRLGYSANAFNAGAGFEIPVSSSLLALDYHYGVQDGLNNNGHAFSVRLDFGGRRRAHSEGDSDFALRKQGLPEAAAAASAEKPGESSRDSRPAPAEQAAKTQRASRVEVAQKRSGKTPEAAAIKPVAGGTWLTIGSTKLEVRSGPGANYKKIGTVYKNSRCEVSRQRDNWFLIRWNGNQWGWVKADAVSKKKLAGK